MYIPKHFSENDLATLHAFMKQYPLALIVTNQDGVPEKADGYALDDQAC